MFKEINLEVEEHSAEWIKDEVQRKTFEAGVYIFCISRMFARNEVEGIFFTEMDKRKAKEITREILEGWLDG